MWKSRMALGFSGSLDSVVCGSPILRECLETRGLATTAPLFQAKRDPWLCRARISWGPESSACWERWSCGVWGLLCAS